MAFEEKKLQIKNNINDNNYHYNNIKTINISQPKGNYSHLQEMLYRLTDHPRASAHALITGAAMENQTENTYSLAQAKYDQEC